MRRSRTGYPLFYLGIKASDSISYSDIVNHQGYSVMIGCKAVVYAGEELYEDMYTVFNKEQILPLYYSDYYSARDSTHKFSNNGRKFSRSVAVPDRRRTGHELLAPTHLFDCFHLIIHWSLCFFCLTRALICLMCSVKDALVRMDRMGPVFIVRALKQSRILYPQQPLPKRRILL